MKLYNRTACERINMRLIASRRFAEKETELILAKLNKTGKKEK